MSTISNERLEELANGDMEVWNSESQSMARELLALRKEREKAEPDFYVVVTSVGVWQSFHRSRAEAEFIVNKPFNPGYSVLEIYTAPPAPTDKPKSEMSQKAEQLLRDKTALAEKLSAEADTTSQQFELLAGKSVVPEGWKLVPIELTKEMRGKIHPFAEALCHGCGREVVADCEDNVTASWNDMLAVAPEPCK
ncbi:hypothetical protein E7W39_10400 [Cronobacter sakazakii]|uniref:hypothetical protein n=1 Tax=Cronobacter sakazakii TaxID=28141 RepID=UPI001F504752|nr:hypothetical protein [Cronobacter sakazakii]MCI0279260.1 hypothetical protein [Cronobacter sakazakii]